MEKRGNTAAGIAAGVAFGAVAVGAAAIAVGSKCLQVARTHAGLARVKMVRGAQGELVRVLQQGGVYQSATYLGRRRFEPVFEYIRAFDAMFEAEDSMRGIVGHGIERVLMLGGGGYSYPKHALAIHRLLAMDVVELDASVTLLARRWFYLDELERMAGDRLSLITADARSYMGEALAAGMRYDVVVNDCFAGSEPVRSLATVEALCQAKVCLNEGGLYVANVVSTHGGENIDFLRNVVATASAVFKRVWVVPCVDEAFAGEDNYLVIASDVDAYDFEGAVPFAADFLGEVLRD